MYNTGKELRKLRWKRDNLVRRLATGLLLIGEAQRRGEDDEYLQQHFQRLLDEYCRLEKSIANLQAEQLTLLKSRTG